ncbi:MAG: hypothetical protein R6X12_07010 [bacterium]
MALLRHVVATLAAAGLLATAGCPGETAVRGTLTLEPGYIGDIRGSNVQLHTTADLSDEPVAAAVSRSGADQRRSEFELVGMPAGSYYLLAWRDVDGDGRLGDRDIAGVGGGTYRPGYGGGPIQVYEGAGTVGIGVNMRTWRDPVDTAHARRSGGLDTTEFSFVFNYDLVLTSLTIHFPGLGTLADPDAPGPKSRGVTYLSGGWTRGGREMPAGRHIVYLAGRLESDTFRLSVPVEVR